MEFSNENVINAVQNRPLLQVRSVHTILQTLLSLFVGSRTTSLHHTGDRSGNNVLNAPSCPRFPMYFLIHVLCLRLLLENKIVLTAAQLANITQMQAIRT